MYPIALRPSCIASVCALVAVVACGSNDIEGTRLDNADLNAASSLFSLALGADGCGVEIPNLGDEMLAAMPECGAGNGDHVPYAPVNEGVYTASTFAVALGMTVQLDELFGGKPRAREREEPEPTARPDASHEQGGERQQEERQEDEEAKASPPPVDPPARADALVERATTAEVVELRRGIDRPKSSKRSPRSKPKRRPRAGAKTLAVS
jgi:hypothetical protein